MIGQLRQKFIATNMLLVSLVLLAVFSIQTFSSYQHAREQIYQTQIMALRWLSQEFRPGFVFGKPPRDNRQRPDGDFPTVPVFAVEIDSDGQIIAIQEGPGATVDKETAQQLVDAALSHSGMRGNLSQENLSYLFQEEETRQFIAFADDRSIASSIRNQLLSSTLIYALALTGFYLISRCLARLALRPAEQAWERQRQFVADASHELKTPITVILANTGIVLAHPDDPVNKQSKWIDYIQDEAIRMKALVDDMLFLAKSDAARLPSHLTSVQLDQLVTGSLLPFESVAFEANVALTEEVAAGITIQGDEAQLRRLIVILLDNAIKYAGGQGSVLVRLDRAQEHPRLTVHNTGPAIPSEHLPHLFERFYRSDPARDRNQGGYGLGLAIAQSIVEGHGGKISVSSTPADGTTFTVVFPKK